MLGEVKKKIDSTEFCQMVWGFLSAYVAAPLWWREPCALVLTCLPRWLPGPGIATKSPSLKWTRPRQTKRRASLRPKSVLLFCSFVVFGVACALTFVAVAVFVEQSGACGRRAEAEEGGTKKALSIITGRAPKSSLLALATTEPFQRQHTLLAILLSSCSIRLLAI